MIFQWIDDRTVCLFQNFDIIRMIRSLLRQLTNDEAAVDEFSLEKLNEMIFGGHAHIALLWTDDRATLVGIGALTVRHHLLRTVAHIDDVVVGESYRGNGFGKKIVEALIFRARAQGAHHIDLSTRLDRVAAFDLYTSLGFQKPKTRFLRLYL